MGQHPPKICSGLKPSCCRRYCRTQVLMRMYLSQPEVLSLWLLSHRCWFSLELRSIKRERLVVNYYSENATNTRNSSLSCYVIHTTMSVSLVHSPDLMPWMALPSTPPFTTSLNNCFCLRGSVAALWCSNPFLFTKETDGRSGERQMGRDRMLQTWRLSPSFKCSSSISPRRTSCCRAPLKSWRLHNSHDC